MHIKNILLDFFQLDGGLKLNNEVSILSARDSTRSFSSGTSAELLSSESSLTGISFTSSSETFGASEKESKEVDETDHVTTMLSSDTQLRLSPRLADHLQAVSSESVRRSQDLISLSSHGRKSEEKCNCQLVLEDNHENLNDDISTPLEFLKPSKSFEDTTLHSKPNSKGCIVKEIPSEFVERCETCFSDKQNQIQQLQRALQDRTESEELLKRRLESLESDLNGAENNSDYWFNQYVKKRNKMNKLLIASREMNSFNIDLRKQIDSKSKILNEKDNEIKRITNSKAETEVLLQEVKGKLTKANEEMESLKMKVRQYEEDKLRSTQLCVQADKSLYQKRLTFATFHGKFLESKRSMDSVRGKYDSSRRGKDDSTIKALTSSEDGKDLFSSRHKNWDLQSGFLDSPLDTPESDTKSHVISRKLRAGQLNTNHRALKSELLKAAEFDGSVSLVSIPLTATNTMLGGKKRNKKAGISKWLCEVIRQVKAELAREGLLITSSKKNSAGQMLSDESRLKNAIKKTDNKAALKYSLKDIVSSLTGKISRSFKTNCSDCYVSGFGERPIALSTWNGKNTSQQLLATGVSTVTFDNAHPFADVFLTNFEYIDFSSPESLVRVQPFRDLFIPCPGSEKVGIKKPLQNSHPVDMRTELTKVQTDHNNENLETIPKEHQARTEKSTVIQERLEGTIAGRKEKPSTDNRYLFVKGTREGKKCNSIPAETLLFNTLLDYSDKSRNRKNEVKSFNTVGDNVEHLLSELDSKTERSVPSLRNQRHSVAKLLQFILKDTKLIPSTRNKGVLYDNHRFIDSVSLEIKFNTKLLTELANRRLFATQRPEEQDAGLTASQTTQRNFKQLTPKKMESQRKTYLASIFVEKNGLCSLSCGLERKVTSPNSPAGTNGDKNGINCKSGAKITKCTEDATKRWKGDLLKIIPETENRDVAIHRVTRESLTKPSCDTSCETFSCVNIHCETITNPKHKARSNVTPLQSFGKESLYPGRAGQKAKQLTRDVSSDHKGQQKKAERDIRISMWREKNGFLGNKSKDKDSVLRHGKKMWEGLARKKGDSEMCKPSRHLRKICQNDVTRVDHRRKDDFKVF